MSKTCYRYFGALFSAQERWLNQMARRGWRLEQTGKLAYRFEPCAPGQFQYAVEFVGDRARADALDYKGFLEELGYRVWEKNLNLNYSVGKVRWRPWAQPGARVSTHANTFDRELLLVEKEDDGRPFRLHTSYADRAGCLRPRRNMWLCTGGFLALAAILTDPRWLIGAALLLLPAAAYQWQMMKLTRQAGMEE